MSLLECEKVFTFGITILKYLSCRYNQDESITNRIPNAMIHWSSSSVKL